jgi:nucleoside-diphosphate-sugar epimerase
MKVFVTGATGYIGGAVVEHLIASGHEVVGLARSENAAGKLRAARAEPLSGDLRDPASLARGCESVDVVVHAGFSHDDWGAMGEAFALDERAVSGMLDALEGTGKAFIYTSGSGVLGDTGTIERDEAFPADTSPFVAQRVGLEASVLAAGASRGIRAVVVRPGLVYGRGGSGIVATMIGLARGASGVGRTVGAGANAWSAVHVEDLAELYVLAVERGPAGTLFNVAAGPPVRMSELAGAISEALGGGGKVEPWPVEQARAALPFADALASDKRISAERAERLLGWRGTRGSLLDEIRLGAEGSYAELLKPMEAGG